jgi:NADP-reducing hydrogenase subunit HndA
MSSKCCCHGSDDREKKLQAVIEKYRYTKGALIPILHETQEIYGYLPFHVQKKVAQALDISPAEVYGVITFYTQFSLEPKGEYEIQVCMGTACYVKGAGLILEELQKELGINVGGCTDDGLFSLQACRCVGACGLAPVMMINDDVYGRLKPKEISGILDKYRKAAAKTA